jgi:hypothetical protein
MRRRTTFALTLAAALCASGAAHADCCDNFWSCVAAVATGGLTCEVENIIASVKNLSATVNNLISTLSSKASDVTGDAQNAVNQAASDMNSAAGQAASDVTNAASRGHLFANPTLANRAAVASASMAVPLGGSPTNGGSGKPGNFNGGSGSGGPSTPNGGSGSGSGGPGYVNGGSGSPVSGGSGVPTGLGGMAGRAAAPPPVVLGKAADPGSVKTALSRGDAYLQDLSARQSGLRNEVANATAGAVACMPQHVVNAQQMVTTVALQPLQLLANSLQDLLAHPDHIFDPSAQIDADITNIQNSVSALFDKMTAEITTEPNARLDAVHPTLDLMQDEDAVAREVADAMQRVASSGSQADLDALNRLLPSAGANARTVRGTQLPAGVFGPKDAVAGAYARLQSQNIPATARHKAEVVDIVNRWAAIKVQKATQTSVDPAHVQRIDPDFQRLRGKPPLEVQRQKQLWIDEARRRFTNDPKTLQKVISYIEAHARS